VKFTCQRLPAPIVVKLPGQRAVRFGEVVLRDGKAFALHSDYNHAAAYTRKMNNVHEKISG